MLLSQSSIVLLNCFCFLMVSKVSTWWSSSSTAKRCAAGPTTWCGGRATPRRLTRGSRPSNSQTARSGSLSTRLPHPADLGPSGLTSVPVRRRSRRLPPRPLRRPPLLRPRPPNPRKAGRWRQPDRRTSAPPSSTGGRTRACGSGASGATAGGPRSPTLSATGRRPPPSRTRSTRSSIRPRTALADPGRPRRLNRRRNGTTVNVPAGSDPAGHIGCRLSVRRTRIEGATEKCR